MACAVLGELVAQEFAIDLARGGRLAFEALDVFEPKPEVDDFDFVSNV